jgi:hypothetical protein
LIEEQFHDFFGPQQKKVIGGAAAIDSAEISKVDVECVEYI